MLTLSSLSDRDFVRTLLAEPEIYAPLAHKVPGYCYLCLFSDSFAPQAAAELGRYPVRSLVEALVQRSDVAKVDQGPFLLSFGSGASARLSQKFQAHVERAPSGGSLLRAKDVLQLMPWGSRFGDDSPGGVDTHLAPMPERSAPSSLLGTLPSPLLRRFCFELSTLTAGKVDVSYSNTVDPTLAPEILAYTKYSGFASFQEVKVIFVPRLGAVHYMMRLSTAWYAENETAPQHAPGFNSSPTHLVHVLAPLSDGGRPDTVSTACGFGYGQQRVFKPAPLAGGHPHLAYRYGSGRLDGKENKTDAVLYDIIIEAVVSLS